MSSASLSEEALERACGVLRVKLQTNNDIRYHIFPSLYPLLGRFQNNNDVEMEVVIAKYLSRCDGRGALKIPSFYTHYEVNVNLIRIMFGF